MDNLNVVLVGVGMRAREGIIPAINCQKNINIAAICDVMDENIQRALPLIDGSPKVIKDYEQLFDIPNIDGAILMTPNYMHAEMAETILKAKMPLYLEKPMGINVNDCNRICLCTEETGTPIMLGMQLRYSDIYSRMKKFLDEGKIGKLQMINYTMLRSQLRGGWCDWRMDKKKSGGSILELSVHHLDLFNWFSGCSKAKVSAFGGTNVMFQNTKMVDNMMIIMEFENGIRCNIEGALFTPGKGLVRNGLYLVGTKAFMYHDDKKIYIKYYNEEKTLEFEIINQTDMTGTALQGFYELVKKGKKPAVSILDGKMAVITAVAAEKSIELGRAVTIEEVYK